MLKTIVPESFQILSFPTRRGHRPESCTQRCLHKIAFTSQTLLNGLPDTSIARYSDHSYFHWPRLVCTFSLAILPFTYLLSLPLCLDQGRLRKTVHAAIDEANEFRLQAALNQICTHTLYQDFLSLSLTHTPPYTRY